MFQHDQKCDFHSFTSKEGKNFDLLKPWLEMFTLEHPPVAEYEHYKNLLTSYLSWLWLCVFQAVNVAGVGPYSEAVLCQTPCSVPAAVSNIYVLKESEMQRYETPADADEDEEDEESDNRPPLFYSPSTCLGISWDPPCDHGSEITSYLIDLGERQPIVVGPVTKHIMQHLQPDTSYRFVYSGKCKVSQIWNFDLTSQKELLFLYSAAHWSRQCLFHSLEKQHHTTSEVH